jgi:hypothetical protein
MVFAIIEPVCAGIMVALINKYLLDNLGSLWSSCSAEETIVDEHDMEEDSVSSTNTTISDTSVHVIAILRQYRKPVNTFPLLTF